MGWVGGQMDVDSGRMSRPRTRFENALFFYDNTGFLRSAPPQSCIFIATFPIEASRS